MTDQEYLEQNRREFMRYASNIGAHLRRPIHELAVARQRKVEELLGQVPTSSEDVQRKLARMNYEASWVGR